MIGRLACSRTRTAATLTCAATLLAGCSVGSDGDQLSPPAASDPSAQASAGAPSATAQATVVEAAYTDGKITGVESRVAVPLGDEVLLRVTSDVPEQIHVHGYDLSLDLVPGRLAEVTFRADKPGAYEVELHKARRPLFQLRVS